MFVKTAARSIKAVLTMLAALLAYRVRKALGQRCGLSCITMHGTGETSRPFIVGRRAMIMHVLSSAYDAHTMSDV